MLLSNIYLNYHGFIFEWSLRLKIPNFTKTGTKSKQ